MLQTLPAEDFLRKRSTESIPASGLAATTVRDRDSVRKTGHYVSGNGSSDYASVAHTTDHNIAGKLVRFSMLLRVGAYPGSTTCLAAKAFTSGGWQIVMLTNGKIRVTTFQDDGLNVHNRVDTASATGTGEWVRLTFDVDDGHLTNMWLDGDSSFSVGIEPTGTYADSTDPLAVLARMNASSPDLFFGGDLADFSIYDLDAGEYIGAWLFASHESGTLTGKPEFDRSGNGNHLIYTGCTANVGEGLPVPQTAEMDWNKGINFVNLGSVSLGTGDPLGFDGASKIEFRGWVFFTGENGIFVIFNKTVNNLLNGFTLYVNTWGDLALNSRSTSADSAQQHTVAVNKGWRYVKAYVDFSTGVNGISIDESAFDTASKTYSSSTYTEGTPSRVVEIGGINVAGLQYDSVIRDVEIYIDDVLTNGWTLYGLNDLTDKVGSVDGTVSGSPAEILIPASLSDHTKDALGNSIDNPRGNRLNFTGWDGDRAEIPYSPALNVTTEAEWFVWGNFYIGDGVAQVKRFVDRWDQSDAKRSWVFSRSGSDFASNGKCRFSLSSDGVAGAALSFIVSNTLSLLRFQYNGTAGTFKVWEYNGGSWTELTVTTEVGTIPASLFTTDLPILLPGTYNTSEPDEYWEGQLGGFALYNRLLTNTEADRFHRATRTLYGA
jgi:hypothetical protein